MLLIDAGDFSVGTLFGMLELIDAPELSLFSMLGYDYVTIGNQEFDWGHGALAGIVNAFGKKNPGSSLNIVASNMIFDDTNPKDDSLKALFDSGAIKTHHVRTLENGLKIGVFGLLGKEAAVVAPFKSPVKIDDQAKTAEKMVKILKIEDKVDVMLQPEGLGFGKVIVETDFDVTGAEIKSGLEVITSVIPLKGDIYYVQFSGLKVKYDNKQPLFDRVREIYVGDSENPLDTSKDNKTLYRVATDIYIAGMFSVLKDYTYGFLELTPKDKNGNPVADLETLIVDRDAQEEGVQELKVWETLVMYLKTFGDKDLDGIPDILDIYKKSQERFIEIK